METWWDRIKSGIGGSSVEGASDTINDPLATTIIILDELSHVSSRPILMPDLQQYFRAILDRRSVPVARFYFDSSALFTQLHDLSKSGYVVRTPSGYELTEQGHEEAHRMRETLPSELTDEFAEAARAIA